MRSAHIKNGQVKSADLARDAVTSGKVRNGSLLAEDFKLEQLPAGPKGDTGTVDTSNFYDKASSDARFLGKTEKAADADKLDGQDPGAYRDLRAYGLVEYGRCTSEVCSVSRAKNIAAVRRAAIGTYCIRPASVSGDPIDPATDLIMAGVEYQQTVTPQGNASAMGAGAYTSGGCNPATEFKVITQRTTATTTAAPANNVSFWVAIP